MKTKETQLSVAVLNSLIRLYLHKHECLKEHNKAFLYSATESNGNNLVSVSLACKKGEKESELIKIDLKMLKALLIEAVLEVKETNQCYYRLVEGSDD